MTNKSRFQDYDSEKKMESSYRYIYVVLNCLFGNVDLENPSTRKLPIICDSIRSPWKYVGNALNKRIM